MLEGIGKFLSKNGAWVMALALGAMYLSGMGIVPMLIMGLVGLFAVAAAKTAQGPAPSDDEAPTPPPNAPERDRGRGGPERERQCEKEPGWVRPAEESRCPDTQPRECSNPVPPPPSEGELRMRIEDARIDGVCPDDRHDVEVSPPPGDLPNLNLSSARSLR